MVEKLITILKYQKDNNIKNNIYYYTQTNFSYNSNKIEGSTLNLIQTEELFKNKFLLEEIDIDKDDLIEMKNHFELFDYILNNYNKILNKEMIIKMNIILKSNTTDSYNKDFNYQGFKIKSNSIGIINPIETSTPENVEKELDKLLNDYNNLSNITIEDIIDFHYKFELIHPFTDGNGRVGRIIMFKECLKNNIIPFIITNEDKDYYLRGLKKYPSNKNYLIDTCKKSQDEYEQMYLDLINKL